MLAEEVFHRAGGLARAVPFLDPMVYFTAGAEAATAFERKEGAAKELLSQYPVKSGDVLWSRLIQAEMHCQSKWHSMPRKWD
jgi:uncharacterized phosphosugar-binding protein